MPRMLRSDAVRWRSGEHVARSGALFMLLLRTAADLCYASQYPDIFASALLLFRFILPCRLFADAPMPR